MKGCCKDVHVWTECGYKVLCSSCSNQSPHSISETPNKKQNEDTPEDARMDSVSSGTQTLSDKIVNVGVLGNVYVYIEDLKQSIKKLKEALPETESFNDCIDKIFGEKLT